MNEQIRYCANGCKTDKQPRIIDGPSRICQPCEKRLHQWLTEIPDLYALLPTFMERGSVDKNPESVATKAAEAPAPMRLEIVDLLDNRLGRKWNGTAAAHDRRGVAGTLQTHTERLIEERNLTQPYDNRDVTASCALLDRHRLWIAEQDWIGYVYDDTKSIHRAISDATGNYRQRPFGTCFEIPEDADEACGGPLFASETGGAHCARCHHAWTPEHLRLLGLALTQDQAAS